MRYWSIDLTDGWEILQDVHDVGERLKLYAAQGHNTSLGNQLSEWEPLERLEHLQVAFAQNPYWGRSLRYFNTAPWWYRRSFDVADATVGTIVLRFTNADYYARVWLNGTLLGDHEGYSAPFEFDVTDLIREGDNTVVVRVWSPWDESVRDEACQMRTFQVERSLVKGTYEHDDTLIARDVNPVGLYGAVSLEAGPAVVRSTGLEVSYQLDRKTRTAQVNACAILVGDASLAGTTAVVRVRAFGTSAVVGESTAVVEVNEETLAVSGTLEIEDVRLWETWDRGTAWLYVAEVVFPWGEVSTATFGFRDVAIRRSSEETTLVLNGDDFFVRGTSYFPDVYMSQMTRERYVRDLTLIKAAGFNLIRVHVHVENREFYELCDEFGIAVMQDSEYNWTHPEGDEFARRLTSIYGETVRQLRNHPSIVTWICLNEPGVHDPDGGTFGFAMTKAPGPAMLEHVRELDPSRPLILGSFCGDDPNSGDTHNYAGSLSTPDLPYTIIDGTTENLNTEFGVDAPGSLLNLREYRDVYDRLASDISVVHQAQHYQERLIKYYIEHYRTQKFDPCSGYVHFMFIDLSPQSWYGVLDWWGVPKPAFSVLESVNQPIGVFLAASATHVDGVHVVNDTLVAITDATLTWTIIKEDGEAVVQSLAVPAVDAGGAVRVSGLALTASSDPGVSVTLELADEAGRLLARNRYAGVFDHPQHVAGHPERMSHEMGMRLYSL